MGGGLSFTVDQSWVFLCFHHLPFPFLGNLLPTVHPERVFLCVGQPELMHTFVFVAHLLTNVFFFYYFVYLVCISTKNCLCEWQEPGINLINFLLT